MIVNENLYTYLYACCLTLMVRLHGLKANKVMMMIIVCQSHSYSHIHHVLIFSHCGHIFVPKYK